MKNTWTQDAVFQAILFNLIFLVVFIFLGIYYFIPSYDEIEEKKNSLEKMVTKYKAFKTTGPSYGEFKLLSSKPQNRGILSKDAYLINLLKEFNKSEYEENFINSKYKKSYDEFLKEKIQKIKKQKLELESQWVGNSIKKILPYYVENAILDEWSLTDFKFINYIEWLLNVFMLESEDKIGIGSLRSMDKSDKSIKKNIKKQLSEGKIYYFDLKLSVTGNKKNVVSFIYFLENVWKVYVKDGKVKVHDGNVESKYVDGEWDIFEGMESSRFALDKNPYDNLVVDIVSFGSDKYLDSGDSINENKTIISLAMDDDEQWGEEYNVDLKLRFYIKGLPNYKVKDFVKTLKERNDKNTKIAVAANTYISKNKTKLKNSLAISSLKDFKRIEETLSELSAKILELNQWLLKQEESWKIYKKALSYSDILDIIEKKLDTNIQAIWTQLYNRLYNKKAGDRDVKVEVDTKKKNEIDKQDKQ